MIKIILLFTLLGITTYLGFQTSKVFITKENFFCDLLHFTKNIKAEISFMKTDIISILNRNQYQSKFGEFLTKYKLLLNDKKQYSKEKITNIINDVINLKNNQSEAISQMFFEMGNIGYYEQIERLEYYVEIFKEFYEESRESSLKMIPLCKKMGILIGFLVCIILI